MCVCDVRATFEHAQKFFEINMRHLLDVVCGVCGGVFVLKLTGHGPIGPCAHQFEMLTHLLKHLKMLVQEIKLIYMRS